MKLLKIFVMASLLVSGGFAYAQSGVSINSDGSDPDGSAILDVKSTSQGLLIPRMTELQRDGITSPATGLIIFQTDGTPDLYIYDGSNWKAAGFSTTGGSGTTGTYGELYEYHDRSGTPSEITITTADTYYGWVSATADNLSNVSFTDNTTADRLTISEAGTYFVQVAISFGTSTNGDIIDGSVFKNGSMQSDLKFRRYLSAGDVGSASISGIISLASSDYLDLRFTSNDDGDKIEVNIINFNIVRID